ncbi:transcriptional regulator, TetR family [Burkholderia sp. GAS332]|nr:transcriptional regulator, TetR family [Burkholderia sp. GAS332]
MAESWRFSSNDSSPEGGASRLPREDESPRRTRRRSLSDEAREARHGAILDEATIEFMRAGVSSAELTLIARRVGLTRAALYHYCSDRYDLVHQCYLQTCELIHSDLQRAGVTHGPGLAKVATFVELMSSPSHRPMAVFSEIELLSAEQYQSVIVAQQRNVAELQTLLTVGVKDGSIRKCNVDIVAEAIFGVLTWAPLSRLWLNVSDDTLTKRMAKAVPQMIIEGIAAGKEERSAVRKRLADVKMPTPTTPREQRLAGLAQAGSRLFNERGIDGVSLDDVAAAVGVTKGVIYHAFKSKPEFVAYCYHRTLDIQERILNVVENSADGVEYTRAIVELHVQLQLSDVHPLWFTTGVENFPPRLRNQLVSRINTILDRTLKLNERGIKDGSLRKFDIAPVRIASVGAFAYVSQWGGSARRLSSTTLAREISSLLLFGLRSSESK